MASTNVEKVDLETLSDEERQIYQIDKMRMFKFTIMICVAYALVATIFLLLILFTSWGRRVLYNEMYAFVITFIIGTTIIVVYLSNEIYNFKPNASKFKTSYDAEMCPDYWKLDYIKKEDLLDSEGRSYVSRQLNENQFRYKCSMDSRLFSAQKLVEMDQSEPKKYKMSENNRLYTTISKDGSGIGKDDKYDEFKKHAAAMSGYSYDNDVLSPNNDNAVKTADDSEFNSEKIPLVCDTVYPMYLSVADTENARVDLSEPNNRNRCAYAKSCGVSWTEAGCT